MKLFKPSNPVITTKSKLSSLMIQLAKSSDLLVLSIGGAHKKDKQQQCPNFCLEAASQGLSVNIINFDPAFDDPSKCLISNQQNLHCHYATVRYQQYQSNDLARDYQPGELKKIILDVLQKSPALKIVVLDSRCPVMNIPQDYLDFAVENYSSMKRVAFILGYYQNASGFVLNPGFLLKVEFHKRAAANSEKLQLDEGANLISIKKNLDKFLMQYRTHWNALTCYTDEGDSGSVGKTFIDYGATKFRENARLAQEDELGYRFVALQCLAFDSLFNPKLFTDPAYFESQWDKEMRKFDPDLYDGSSNTCNP